MMRQKGKNVELNNNNLTFFLQRRAILFFMARIETYLSCPPDRQLTHDERLELSQEVLGYLTNMIHGRVDKLLQLFAILSQDDQDWLLMVWKLRCEK
jgi:hypothetical protein